MKKESITSRDGANKSIWEDVLSQTNDHHTDPVDDIFDTLVIGGGITGITTALMLQQQGQKCILAEAHNLGFGTTGGTTAHLNTFLDATYPEIDSDFSPQASQLMASAAKDMIALIRANIERLEIDADFEEKAAYLFSQNEQETQTLHKILSSSLQAGVAVSEVFENGIRLPFEHVLRFEGQAQFHPLKYILGLATEFERLGGIILENVFIEELTSRHGLHQVSTPQLNILAKHVVYATHIPPGINLLSFRNAPYRSYVLAVRLKDGQYPADLSYDMQEPYHYFRSHEIAGKKYLIIGGEDHKTGHSDPQKAFQTLEAYARENFDIDTIDYQWSSQYYVPVDGLPYIGELPGGAEGIYLATGFNGNGMILGSLSACIISDLILGKENPYIDLLSPSRIKPIAGFSEFVKENADVAYHFIADRIQTPLTHSASALNPGEGKVVSLEGEKLAIYKDAQGKIFALNPVCSHAGCIVNWNSAEKSWDCPCHGGRFAIDGKVLTGPPRSNLRSVDLI